MKRTDVFPSKYLGKDDVESPFTAIIGDVLLETIKGDGSDEDKAVLHFAGKAIKPMILNNTNWMTLEEAYGEDSDGWKGKPVDIYIDPGVMYGGKRVGGVRLRIPAKNGGANGNGNGNYWTLDQAVKECGKIGVSRENLLAYLKDKGLTAWNSQRDTQGVKDFIKANVKTGPVTQEEIDEVFADEAFL